MSRRSRLLERLGLLLSAAVVVIAGLSSIRSWDIWWHLKTGELALNRLSTLPIDELSLTRAGEPWLYKDLGAEVLFYAIYSVAGEAGLATVKLAVAIGIFALFMAIARRRTPAPWLALLVAGMAFVVAAFRIIVRPEAFSLLLLLSTVLLVDRWRSPPTGPSQSRDVTARFGVTLLSLAGVHLAWANLHRGVVLGLLVLWAQLLYELCVLAEARLLGRPPRLFRIAGGTDAPNARRALSAAAFAGAATVASTLNPFGLRPLLMAFDVTASESLSLLVSEWQRLSLAEHWQHFPVATIWMAAAAATVTAALIIPALRGGITARRGDSPTPWDLGMVALFIAIGLSAVRMLPLMVIGTCGPMTSALSRLFAFSPRGLPRRSGSLSAIVGLAVFLVAWANPQIQPSRPGFANDWYPEDAVELLLSAPVRGEGYTAFIYAGYVIFHAWPEKHVICDGRFDTVYDDQTMTQCLLADRNPAVWDHLQQTLGLEWALTHNRPTASDAGPGTGSFAFFDRDPEWTLIYWDTTSLLYVRSRGPNRELARTMGYVYLRPHDPDVSLFEALQRTAGDARGRTRLLAELERLQAAAPDDYRTQILLALYLHETGASDTEELRIVIEALRLNRDRNPTAIDQVLEWIGAPSER